MQEQKQGYEASNDMFSSSLISFFPYGPHQMYEGLKERFISIFLKTSE